MAKVTAHAKQRALERAPGMSVRELARKFRSGDVLYVARKTASRSLIYARLSTGWVKAIVNRRSRRIITVLPWAAEREATVSVSVEGIAYRVTIAPDAYTETGNEFHLAEVSREDGQKVRKGHFPLAVQEAWRAWRESQRIVS